MIAQARDECSGDTVGMPVGYRYRLVHQTPHNNPASE